MISKKLGVKIKTKNGTLLDKGNGYFADLSQHSHVKSFTVDQEGLCH